MISRCPKRVVEDGIAGTLDLGYCTKDCAAFECRVWNNEEFVWDGYCKEYHCEVKVQ